VTLKIVYENVQAFIGVLLSLRELVDALPGLLHTFSEFVECLRDEHLRPEQNPHVVLHFVLVICKGLNNGFHTIEPRPVVLVVSVIHTMLFTYHIGNFARPIFGPFLIVI
jgi:hypothetical protein